VPNTVTVQGVVVGVPVDERGQPHRLRECRLEARRLDLMADGVESGSDAHGMFNEISALATALFGRPGFFTPRFPPPPFHPPGTPAALNRARSGPRRRRAVLNDVEIALSAVVIVVFAVDRLRLTRRMDFPSTRP